MKGPAALPHLGKIRLTDASGEVSCQTLTQSLPQIEER